MAEEPNQIERDIENERRELGDHVQELETRLQEAADWRTYVRRKPLTMLTAAFGAGVMLAFTFGGRRQRTA